MMSVSAGFGGGGPRNWVVAPVVQIIWLAQKAACVQKIRGKNHRGTRRL
jgi:hypothetical protein